MLRLPSGDLVGKHLHNMVLWSHHTEQRGDESSNALAFWPAELEMIVGDGRTLILQGADADVMWALLNDGAEDAKAA